MYKPQSIQKFYKDSTKPVTRKIPKSLYAFFFILQFCFGFDFGFTKALKPHLRNLSNCITFLVGIGISIILTAPYQKNMAPLEVYWVTTRLMHYIVYFIVLHYFTQYTVYDFINEMNKICKTETATNREYFGVLTLAYTFVIHFIKVSIFFGYCLKETCDYYIPIYVYDIPSHATDIVPTVITLIYTYVYFSIKQLTQESSEAYIDIDTMQRKYMSITDCYDKIKTVHDNLFITMLLFELPHLIGMMWFLLHYIKEGMGWFKYMLETVYCFHIIVQLSVSAVVAEMINIQYEALRLTLHKMWISTKDKDKITALRHLLRYMKVQTLHHKAWRMIPTDVRLLVSLFSLCATYIIVVVQFTHLFE